MCAIYAFMRYCDDISDEPRRHRAQPSNAGATNWKTRSRADIGEHPLWPAFHDTVRRYSIPHEYFHEMIDGVSSDLEPRQIQTFDELYRYCYQVASVVGLTIIHIFGFESPTPCRWPKNAASRSSSPTSCATSAKIAKTAASTSRPRTSAGSARTSPSTTSAS